MPENSDGWIKLYRKFTSWGWYKNDNMKSVFIHCLISANFADGFFEDTSVPKGSFVSSYEKIAEELGKPKSTVRDCIKRLEATQELARTPHGKLTVFTVINYDKYQGVALSPHDARTTGARSPHDARIYTTYKKNKKNKKGRNIPPAGEKILSETDDEKMRRIREGDF